MQIAKTSMQSYHSLFIFVALFLLYQSKHLKADMDAKALAAAVSKFSAKFVNELDKSKSTVSSPLSAKFVLALLALGTEDPAHGEILTALGIPDDNSIRTAFSSVSEKLKAVKGVTLNVANKVYLMDMGCELHSQMENDAVKVFDAAIEKVNFGKSAEAAKLINTWVESKTNSRIKDLLQADDLNNDTRLVLVNAIYFKGTWKKQFDVSNTRDLPFHVTASKTIDIPMMYMENHFRYGHSEELQAQLLEMPYVGDEASMVIVLPNEVEGLNGVLQKLAAGYNLIDDIENKMYSTKVQVTIPKFKIETQIDLNELLPKLGIKAIFNRGNSGLTKLLNNNEPLFVSKAIQKAFIEVNEEGAEAAAATDMEIMLRCAPPSFEARQPFVYILLDKQFTPLFTGIFNGKI